MLVRALRRNLEGLQDSAKQLLIWLRTTKAEFSTHRYDDDYDEDYFSETERKRQGNYKYNKYGRNNYGFNNRRFRESDLFLRNSDLSFDNLKPIVKDFYQFHPQVLSRSKEEINEFIRNHDINVFGRSASDCPPPILSFDELNLPKEAFDVVRELGFSEPTPVQSLTWPIALGGRNMVGISRTGSGKTLGFVLPALFHIQHQPPLEKDEGPVALVIAPTRELVNQIVKVVMPFAKKMGLGVVALFGGQSKMSQVEQLRYKNEICIATPGRLNDILNSCCLDLRRCTYFVLDEADRLLDMGFHPQIKSILHYCRPDRQILMWSATWPKDVQSLAKQFLEDHIAVKFGSEELVANSNIKQVVHVCDNNMKLDLLLDLLGKINEENDAKTLIFTKTKIKAEGLANILRRRGFRVLSIHGDKKQFAREKVLADFRNGRKNILVGTQVVGRGIDIDDIQYVINFDFPTDIESYVHCIGRTARRDKPGTAHSFFTSEDASLAKDLIKILEQSNQPVNPELKNMIHRKGFSQWSKKKEWNDYY